MHLVAVFIFFPPARLAPGNVKAQIRYLNLKPTMCHSIGWNPKLIDFVKDDSISCWSIKDTVHCMIRTHTEHK